MRLYVVAVGCWLLLLVVVALSAAVAACCTAWMTPDLFTKMARQPMLLKSLTDPKFQAVLEKMGSDPSEALALCKVRVVDRVWTDGWAGL